MSYITTHQALHLRTLTITVAIVRNRGMRMQYRDRNVISPIQGHVREHIRDRQMYEPRA